MSALLAALPAIAGTTGTRATIPDILTFALSATIIVLGAVGVVTSRNPVHAALSLVLTLFGVAVLFVEQHADFLAAVQVIVYAGAIVVLFLFVIMFLGVDRTENVEAEPLAGQRPLAFVAMAVALAAGVALVWKAHGSTGAHAVAGPTTTAHHHSNVYLLGQSVFTTYLYAFEATAALLVIAVVGAVVLARRPPGPIDELDQPEDGGAGTTDATDTADMPDAADEAGRPAGAGTGDPEHEAVTP
jgi:NADH-quinone oxidoreductase subunit J